VTRPTAAAERLSRRAGLVLPGGVSSPVRAFRAVGGTPPALISGQGAHVLDEDGNDYIDFVLAYGPHLLGHNPPQVVEAVRRQLERGLAFGATTGVEVELAERLTAAMPSLEMVRFVSSGTEATMSALRLARAATGRDLIVKFAGAYHGHADALLAEAGSGVATLGIPDSPGVPASATAATVVLPYNDAAAVSSLFARRGGEIAAVIVEPVAGNMGCVPPRPGFLEQLRRETSEHGSLLVFDEVMTGFRVSSGGAQSLFGVRPDLTTLGKVIGGGLPVGAYGGRRDLMQMVAPAGPVYQAGTLSGSPAAMAAGIAVLDSLDDEVYERIDDLGARLASALDAAFEAAGWQGTVNRVGGMLTPFIGVDEVSDFASAKHADTAAFAAVHAAWLESGVLWPPSQFEAAFLSTAHSDSDIDHTAGVFAATLTDLSARRAG